MFTPGANTSTSFLPQLEKSATNLVFSAPVAPTVSQLVAFVLSDLYTGVGKFHAESILAPSLPAACTSNTPLLSAYFTASSTQCFSGETPLPKLILTTLAPLSTA